MKTIQEIKNEVAVNNGYVDWRAVMFYHKQPLNTEEFSEIVNEAMQQYAKQCCDELRTKIGVFLVDKNHVKASLDLMSFNPNVVKTK